MQAADWYELLVHCNVKPTVAAMWADVFFEEAHPSKFSKGVEELDEFVGNVLHESAGLTRLSENLDYSAQRLVQVWPGRFPTVEAAQPYAHNPVALANKVYAGRLGNTESGDGWKYRGRAPIQITGRANYRRVGDLMGQDLESNPDLLEQPRFALEACVHWWEDRIPDDILGDPEKVTRRVNGGLIGLAEREHLTALAQEGLA